MTGDMNAIRGDWLAAGVRGAADRLSLAATPTFAIMALLAGVLGGPHDMLCAAAHGASPFSGMVWMYVLMSAFHSAPWLRLITSGGTDAHSSRSGGEAAAARSRVARVRHNRRYIGHSVTRNCDRPDVRSYGNSPLGGGPTARPVEQAARKSRLTERTPSADGENR